MTFVRFFCCFCCWVHRQLISNYALSSRDIVADSSVAYDCYKTLLEIENKKVFVSLVIWCLQTGYTVVIYPV